MSKKRKQSLFIIIYPGEETADKVYQTLRGLEKQDKIEIKTAATLYRTEDSKLQLRHRQRLTLWRDEFDIGSIGLILAGTRAETLAGALVGALFGPSRSEGRCEARTFLDDKLGQNDSALVILATNADWAAAQSRVSHFGGEELAFELTPKAERQLAEIASDEGVATAVRKFVEIEEATI